jgi:hypothetical protein
MSSQQPEPANKKEAAKPDQSREQKTTR